MSALWRGFLCVGLVAPWMACDLDPRGTSNEFPVLPDASDATVDPEAGGCPGANLQTDTVNCGACGHVCASSNAIPTCARGACAFACTAGYADCDGLDGNGCEKNVTLDPANCGACGRDCGGGECRAGVCQPSVVAANQSRPYGIAVDATYVFWTTQGATEGQGAIWRAKLDGSAAIAIAQALVNPTLVAADGPSLYWITPGSSAGSLTGALYGVHKDGTALGLLAYNQPLPSGLALDVANAYVSNAGGTIIRQRRDVLGGTTALATSEPGPAAIAVDSSGLFWANQGTAAQSYVDGNLVSAKVDGGAAAPVYTSQDMPTSIALDADNVYVLSKRDGALRRVPRAGGSIVPLATGEKSPLFVVAEGSALYFTSEGSPGVADGAVKVIGKDGKCPPGPCPRVLASGQASPGALAVDAKFVYWINAQSGTVLRVAK